MLAVAQTALAFCAAQSEFSYIRVNLQIACAIALNELGHAPEAEAYLLAAMDACLPRGYTMALAVNVLLAGGLIEKLLRGDYPAYTAAVLEQANRVIPNWIDFHNRFTEDNITQILMPKDYQMARLATQGMSYGDIAERFYITRGAVANRMQMVYEMLFITGQERKKKLAKYVL